MKSFRISTQPLAADDSRLQVRGWIQRKHPSTGRFKGLKSFKSLKEPSKGFRGWLQHLWLVEPGFKGLKGRTQTTTSACNWLILSCKCKLRGGLPNSTRFFLQNSISIRFLAAPQGYCSGASKVENYGCTSQRCKVRRLTLWSCHVDLFCQR